MSDQPVIFTFYSFKGGVGRSMALLNLAYGLVAKGRNVLMLDMDLEAPGISGFLSRGNEISQFPRLDMLDLLQWAKVTAEQVSEEAPLNPSALPPLSDYAVRISPEKLQSLPHPYCELGRLDVIPIEVDRKYYDRLPAVAVSNMDRQTLVRVGSLLRSWLTSRRIALEIPDYYGPVPDKDRSALYDYVLIDSRTGSTEVGGLCIGPLSDQLVVLCGLNDQNIEDTRHFLMEVGVLQPRAEVALSPKLGKPTLFVPSPAPTGELTLKTTRLSRMKERLGAIETELTYHPQMALMETIFVRDYPEDDLTTRYKKLLGRVLSRAGDRGEPDSMLLEKFTRQKSLIPKVRSTLRSLLRSAPISNRASLLLLALDQFDLESVTNDDDFQLLDRTCRALTNGDSSLDFVVLGRWSDVLVRWSRCSSDPALAALRFAEAIDRVDRIVDSPELSVDGHSIALFNRGVIYGDRGENDRALVDYTTVIEMPDAPAEQKAMALVNRGVTYGKQNEVERELADYTSVIEMPDAPAEQKAKALVNRGVTYGSQNEVERELADYTSVIEMSDALAEQKAKALLNRGIAYGKQNEVERELADYTSVIEMPDAPAEQKAKALVNRGVTYGSQDEVERELADYTLLIEMPDAPAEQKANALINRGWHHFSRGEVVISISDFRQAVMLKPRDVTAQGNLAIASLVDGQASEAQAAYDSAIELASAAHLADMRQDLSVAVAKHGPLTGADEVRLRIDARIAQLQKSPGIQPAE